MEQTFTWTVNRRKLVIILVICTIVCLTIRLSIFCFSDPTTPSKFVKEVLTPLFDNLSATFIVSLVVAITYLFLKAEEELLKLLKIRSQIEEELFISKSNTNAWLFSGGTGSETRKVTLPFLAKLKRERGVAVKIQVINPKNKWLCDHYADYRARRNSADGEWNLRNVQLKTYATIVSCLYWCQSSELKIEIYLKNSYSTLRYDISDDRVIITKENPNSPAYLVRKPNSFFDAILTEFTVTENLAEKLEITRCKRIFHTLLLENTFITKQALIEQFACLNIDEAFTDEEYKYILESAKPNKVQ